MLRLNPLEVIQRFRKPGGHEFVGFCNQIIRASCWASGIPQSEVWTSSRTDAKDKGVDTRVEAALPTDKSGYFDAPTIWQFKAADESNVSKPDMAKEVNKERSTKWILEGSAYRLCICDHLTPDKKKDLTDALTAAVSAIDPNAPIPKLLSIDDVVELANSFPALVLQYLPRLDAICIIFERFEQTAKAVTPVFVSSGGFTATKAAVLTHIDISKDVRSPVITLYGNPGAGKTRIAYECLREVPVAASLVLYTTSEDDVLELANMLVNDRTARAIVVADECSIDTRERLVKALMHFRDRVRCICIDNSAQRVSTPSPELVVPKLTPVELEEVLSANFKGVLRERLRAYAQLCDGSVRLAADMCAHYDSEIAQAGSMSPVLGKIDEYYRARLKDESHRQAVEAVALLKRVKYKGDDPTDLDLICKLVDVDKRNIERALGEIKDVPGWVEKGALYYRVTPDLIAMTAFGSAWDRWVKGNEDDFLKRIPASIQESFLQRVSESASSEVREIVQAFFRRFADDFTSRQLADVRSVNRLVSLIETDPGLYLPALRRVIDAASREELTNAPRSSGFSWGPRRQLVWTAEKFAVFPEHFADSEAILFKLAQNECELQIGNNATKTWQRLFSFQLSGTALPFIDRLGLLSRRLTEATPDDSKLLTGALGELFNLMGGRILGPPVIGGQVPPPEWYPKDREERKASFMSGLALLDRSVNHPTPAIAQASRKTLVDDLDVLARLGWLGDLRPFVQQSHLDEADKASLFSRLSHFLARGKHPDNSDIKPEYEKELSDWMAELEPKSLHGRLVTVVGGRPIDYFGREKEWERELDALAGEFLSDPPSLDAEIDWLTSDEANAAYEFGSRLGTLDSAYIFIDKLIDKSRERNIGCVRGYIAGLLYGANIPADIVGTRLDELELRSPLYAFQIALVGGSRVHVFDRAMAMIKSGTLPAYHLRAFTVWVGEVRITNEQTLAALRVLLPFASDDQLCCDVMVDFLGARVHQCQLGQLLDLDTKLVWEVLTVATRHPGRETYWLEAALRAAAPTNHMLAIQLASEALIGDSYALRDEAESLLASWATEYPDEVMDAIGGLMLDEEKGWLFFASRFSVFNAIPTDVVIKWLESVGVRGAQKLARHLPPPYVDSDGVPTVPKLTEFVLSRFEADELTFREFCAGTHSFQVYTGDIASQREAEASAARPFFNHSLSRIREWARYEFDSGKQDATTHREMDDEMGI